MGDGTTSVVILASELLKRANELVKNQIHPTSIMSGYRLAMKESVKFIKSHIAVKTEKLGREVAFNIAKTTLSSKIFGRESEFFANLAVDAMNMVKTESTETGRTVYPVKSVGILKQHGRSFKDSQLINGCAQPPRRMALTTPSPRLFSPQLCSHTRHAASLPVSVR